MEGQKEISFELWAMAQLGWPSYTTLRTQMLSFKLVFQPYAIHRRRLLWRFGQQHKFGRLSHELVALWNYELLDKKSLDRGITYGSSSFVLNHPRPLKRFVVKGGEIGPSGNLVTSAKWKINPISKYWINYLVQAEA